MDTIYALASGQGKCGISIVRISGPQAFFVGKALCKICLKPRKATFTKMWDNSGEVIDEGLAVFFEGPASFTGEDVLELHIHGSSAVLDSINCALSRMVSLRMAEPGEFTRRALMNNKLDLAQVEGLKDLIDSETEAQRKQAQRVLSGQLGLKVEEWRSCLVKAIAFLEVMIDFSDEEVPSNVFPEVLRLLSMVKSDLKDELDGVGVAERVRKGFEVALVGLPNVGKSSLLNRLAGREVAITSEIEGTTRDIVEVSMDLNGIPVNFLDTAGLRDSKDPIERQGIEKAKIRSAEADIVVILTNDGMLPADIQEDEKTLVVYTKGDLTGIEGAVSSKTGEGLQLLVSELSRLLKNKMSTIGVATRNRHNVAISRAISNIDQAIEKIDSGWAVDEFVAEDIRSAVSVLEALVGKVGVEDVLDEIFSNFCLGK